MRIQPTLVFAGILAVLGSPVAHAFTIENTQPAENKFDLDEQIRQFSTGNTSGSAAGQNRFQTPLGDGTLRFGVQQGSSFSGSGFGSRTTREDFNRVVTPENMR